MLRETGFVLGGTLLIALGVSFWVALAIAGVGWDAAYLYGYVVLGIALGGFFVYVGRAERRARQAFLERENSSLPR
ncbi:MAG: hypothetical protein HKL79_06830 [Thermoplasmata archaeon]|jgi:hypothetical protein|nr:hypothetical protein [Thermoplasmata archaeon]